MPTWPLRFAACVLLRSLFRHLDIDFADFLDGQQTLGDKALRDHRFEFVEQNIDRVDLAAAVAGDHALAERGGEIVFDLAQNSDILAGDLHAAGAGNGRIVGRDGRNARLSIGQASPGPSDSGGA